MHKSSVSNAVVGERIYDELLTRVVRCARPFDVVVNSAYALLTTVCDYNLTNTRKPSLLVYTALAPIVRRFEGGTNLD